MAAVIVTDATFADEVLASKLPVLVDFWAAWCGPCALLSPIVEKICGELEGRLLLARVDADASPVTTRRYAIFSLPTLVLFRDGREVERVIGFRRKKELAARLLRHIDRA
ncbi:MAG: thioredoxin [Candidatus Limnocylindrales bacterium]